MQSLSQTAGYSPAVCLICPGSVCFAYRIALSHRFAHLCLSLEHDNVRAYIGRGMIKRDQGLLQEALKDLNRAVEHGSQIAYPYVVRALVWSRLENTEKAMKDLSTAVYTDPGMAGAAGDEALAWVWRGLQGMGHWPGCGGGCRGWGIGLGVTGPAGDGAVAWCGGGCRGWGVGLGVTGPAGDEAPAPGRGG